MSRTTSCLILLLLAVACFSLATALQPRVSSWSKEDDSGNVMKVLLGDGRRIFANQAFIEADVYFHAGYYPSVFDQTRIPKDARHMTAKEGSAEEEEHEREMNFLGPPLDWIERFGRHFLITEHEHLHGGTQREILPWLRLSADLDPHRITTYTVASYWLRRELGKPQEAQQFLREGLRNNPESYELLLELGRLYNENYHQRERARNLWNLALRRWQEQETGKHDADVHSLEEITINLARVEEADGDLRDAVVHLQMAARVSPNPGALRQQIAVMQRKLASAAGVPIR